MSTSSLHSLHGDRARIASSSCIPFESGLRPRPTIAADTRKVIVGSANGDEGRRFSDHLPMHKYPNEKSDLADALPLSHNGEEFSLNMSRSSNRDVQQPITRGTQDENSKTLAQTDANMLARHEEPSRETHSAKASSASSRYFHLDTKTRHDGEHDVPPPTPIAVEGAERSWLASWNENCFKVDDGCRIARTYPRLNQARHSSSGVSRTNEDRMSLVQDRQSKDLSDLRNTRSSSIGGRSVRRTSRRGANVERSPEMTALPKHDRFGQWISGAEKHHEHDSSDSLTASQAMSDLRRTENGVSSASKAKDGQAGPLKSSSERNGHAAKMRLPNAAPFGDRPSNSKRSSVAEPAHSGSQHSTSLAKLAFSNIRNLFPKRSSLPGRERQTLPTAEREHAVREMEKAVLESSPKRGSPKKGSAYAPTAASLARNVSPGLVTEDHDGRAPGRKRSNVAASGHRAQPDELANITAVAVGLMNDARNEVNHEKKEKMLCLAQVRGPHPVSLPE